MVGGQEHKKCKFEFGDIVKVNDFFRETYKDEVDGEDYDRIKLYLDDTIKISGVHPNYDDGLNWYTGMLVDDKEFWFKEKELMKYDEFELGEELFLI